MWKALAWTLLVLVSLGAFVFLLPSLKEGYGIEELPVFAGVAAALGITSTLWWRVGGSRKGLAVVAVPLAAYLLLCADIAMDELQGRWLASTVRITRLKQTPILWVGFDGPVGIRLEIEVQHRIGREGNLQTPRILMSRPRNLTQRSYYLEDFSEYKRVYLAPPLFSFRTAPEPANARMVMAARGAVNVTYDLYSSVVRNTEGSSKVCVSVPPAAQHVKDRAVYADGDTLAASWFFAGNGGVYVDLSAPLTAALRQYSSFQGKPKEWERMLRQLEPANLAAAGYRACGSPAYGETCYCR